MVSSFDVLGSGLVNGSERKMGDGYVLSGRLFGLALCVLMIASPGVAQTGQPESSPSGKTSPDQTQEPHYYVCTAEVGNAKATRFLNPNGMIVNSRSYGEWRLEDSSGLKYSMNWHILPLEKFQERQILQISIDQKKLKVRSRNSVIAEIYNYDDDDFTVNTMPSIGKMSFMTRDLLKKFDYEFWIDLNALYGYSKEDRMVRYIVDGKKVMFKTRIDKSIFTLGENIKKLRKMIENYSFDFKNRCVLKFGNITEEEVFITD